ncbi:hypothetical protein HAX54_031497 [Datura stramonium]|uniref:Uncharacterized protein n=1 Tax=Datura stramonium TaxID=4076 RepID=A0ABS8V9D2_DATST|nr:hypothetical protein [Datura stramonium]
MAPKVNKGKGLASSSHGSKRARTTSEEEHEDVSMVPQPLRQYGLCWVTEKEDRILTLGLGLCLMHRVTFAPKALNKVLGTPNVDPQPFVDMVKKPLYRNIRHILCGPNSVARWALHQQLGMKMLQLRMNGVTKEQLQQLNIGYALSEPFA